MLVRLVLLALLTFPAACSYYSGPGVPDINDVSAGSDAAGDYSEGSAADEVPSSG